MPVRTPGRLAQGAVADGANLAAEAGDGVAVGIQLGPAEQLEDALLHPLRDHVFEPFRLVVDLVEAVPEDADQEHLEKAMVADQLQTDLAALARQLLTAIAVVLDEALRGQPGHHLAHAWGRDAEALGQLAGGDRPLVTTEQIEGFQVVLLRAGEGAATLELLDQFA